MAQPTESYPGGSAAGGRGPALAILTQAPRPGLVGNECCPPWTPAEIAALHTAWLKRIAQEMAGVAVFLFGRPTDALPMLRYFAGPGVELREWRGDPAEPAAAVAAALQALGHGPVLVRTATAPDATEADVRLCLAAAQRGETVLAADQRGDAWLQAFPALRTGGPPAGDVPPQPRRGPWARTVHNADDLALLLHERGGPEAVAAPPPLPVRDLQAALQFYETVLGTELLLRDETGATLGHAGFRLRLQARGAGFTGNGLRLDVADVETPHAAAARHGAIAPRDGLAVAADGRACFGLVDADGNRLWFRGPAT